jgi:hypothetical protein
LIGSNAYFWTPAAWSVRLGRFGFSEKYIAVVERVFVVSPGTPCTFVLNSFRLSFPATAMIHDKKNKRDPSFVGTYPASHCSAVMNGTIPARFCL